MSLEYHTKTCFNIKVCYPKEFDSCAHLNTSVPPYVQVDDVGSTFLLTYVMGSNREISFFFPGSSTQPTNTSMFDRTSLPTWCQNYSVRSSTTRTYCIVSACCVAWMPEKKSGRRTLLLYYVLHYAMRRIVVIPTPSYVRTS